MIVNLDKEEQILNFFLDASDKGLEITYNSKTGKYKLIFFYFLESIEIEIEKEAFLKLLSSITINKKHIRKSIKKTFVKPKIVKPIVKKKVIKKKPVVKKVVKKKPVIKLISCRKCKVKFNPGNSRTVICPECLRKANEK